MNPSKARIGHTRLLKDGLHDILEGSSRSAEAHRQAARAYLTVKPDLSDDICTELKAYLLNEVAENLCDNNTEKARLWLNKVAEEFDSPTTPSEQPGRKKKGQRQRRREQREREQQAAEASTPEASVETQSLQEELVEEAPVAEPVTEEVPAAQEETPMATVTHLPIAASSESASKPLTAREIESRFYGKDAIAVFDQIVPEILRTMPDDPVREALINCAQVQLEKYYATGKISQTKARSLSKARLKKLSETKQSRSAAAAPTRQQSACA